nr:MAG TPA: hypothetical protein [Caudoviricetes sp.]
MLHLLICYSIRKEEHRLWQLLHIILYIKPRMI